MFFCQFTFGVIFIEEIGCEFLNCTQTDDKNEHAKAKAKAMCGELPRDENHSNYTKLIECFRLWMKLTTAVATESIQQSNAT